jgi:urease accessory protein
MQQTRGKLRLHFTRDSEHQRTQLIVREQCPPLQVIRAFPLSSGGALVHIHNISGGVLGGDQLALDVEVGPGAHAQLTSTSATRLYRSRPETPMSASNSSRIVAPSPRWRDWVPIPTSAASISAE